MKSKKILWIALACVDAALTIFLFVIHIIMLASTVGKSPEDIRANASGLIGYLQLHTTFYLWLFVIPLFVLLAANIVWLVLYVRKATRQEKEVSLDNLSEEQRQALLAQIAAEASEKKEEK